jgi:glycosyltransferase involved in cell wall biosynthesis
LSNSTEVVQVGFVTGEGGDALQMKELSAALIRRAWPTRIVVPQTASAEAFAARCIASGIPVEQSAAVRADINGAQQNVAGLVRLFRTFRNSILHLHTGDVCLARRVMVALAVVRPRSVFVTIQSPYDNLASSDMRARMWARAAGLLIRKVICPSRHGQAAQLRYGVPAQRVQVIHNCVDVRTFACGDPEYAHRALGLPAGSRLIVFSARLDGQKRPMEALKAFLDVASEFPDAHLIFVGAGPAEPDVRDAAMRSAVANRVHFAGYQKNVPDWLASAAVWILPTESENFSLAVLEALAACCAIVSTRCQGNDEILMDCCNALLTEVGDVAGQSRALRLLLTDEDMRLKLSRQARKTASEYGSDTVVAAVIRCYEDALANR